MGHGFSCGRGRPQAVHAFPLISQSTRNEWGTGGSLREEAGRDEYACALIHFERSANSIRTAALRRGDDHQDQEVD